MLLRRLFAGALAAWCLAPGAAAEDIKARGVNPADNETRVDAILKHNRLVNRAAISTLTLKFDYRLSKEWGFNLEVPVLGQFRVPSPAPGQTGLGDAGVGDVFLRLRYIASAGDSAWGATSLGVAAEAVLPSASAPTLGAGGYQLNASALLVQAWSPALITAVIGKAAQSVEERSGRRPLQENTARIVQAFIFPNGIFATLDAKYNWETINRQDVWWEGAVEIGMMLDASTSTSISISRKWRDREDRGAVSLGLKRFF